MQVRVTDDRGTERRGDGGLYWFWRAGPRGPWWERHAASYARAVRRLTAHVPSEMFSNALRECFLGRVVDWQDAALRHDGMELLPVVRDARRQRGNVPVQVRVALSAAQAEGVHPLGRYGSRHGESDPADHALEAEELGLLR